MPEESRFVHALRRSPLTALAAVLFLSVVTLASLNLHGSSIGQFHRVFYGAEAVDDDLVAFDSRPIRSDEWLRWTPVVVSQSKLDYPETNEALRDGIDLSLIYDVPHGGWTAVFEPHHAAFHVTNLEFAFSFKWFGMAAYSFFAAVACAHRFGRVRFSLSLLLGAFWVLAPFFHWWYQAQAFMTGAHVLLILALVPALYTASSMGRRLALGGLIGYLTAAAIVIQYPPFFVGAMLPAVAAALLDLWRRSADQPVRELLARAWVSLATATAVAAAIGVAFLASKSERIQAISDSEHPGGRSFESGLADLPFVDHLLSSNLAPFLLDDVTAANYFTNQSEASNVLFVLPFIALGLVFRLWDARSNHRPLDRMAIGYLALGAGVGAWLFIPGVTPLFSLFFFPQIPLFRFAFMLGMIQFLALVSFVAASSPTEERPAASVGSPAVLASLGAITMLVTLAANRFVVDRTTGFVDDRRVWLITVILFVGGVTLILASRSALGLGALCVLAFWSVVAINPLYRGLDAVTDTPIVDAIERLRIDDPDAAWVINGGIMFENIPIQAGAESMSGGAPYTQASYWRHVYSDDPDAEVVYDRSAHVAIDFTEGPTTVELQQKNWFNVFLNPCGEVADAANVGWVVSVRELADPCLELIEVVSYPRISFHIYNRSS